MHLTHLSSVHITKNNSENVSVPFEKKKIWVNILVIVVFEKKMSLLYSSDLYFNMRLELSVYLQRRGCVM